MDPISMAEVLVLGYLLSAGVYLLLAALVSREGRRVLMTGRHLSRAYYIQLGLSWMFAAVAGVSLMLQLTPAGHTAIAATLAGALGLVLSLVLLRTHTRSLSQESWGDYVLLVLCIATGCAVATLAQFRTQ